MGSEGRRTVRSPEVEYACPVCGKPVGTVIKRRKVLGAFVPEWVPGPCHNEACALGAEEPVGPPGPARAARHERTRSTEGSP
ncbi:hypothetical protein V1460_07485 [Streptomyces sp. SCSIO 30461]